LSHFHFSFCKLMTAVISLWQQIHHWAHDGDSTVAASRLATSQKAVDHATARCTATAVADAAAICHNVVALKLWHCGDACCLGVVVAVDVLVVVEMLLLGVAVASVASVAVASVAIAVAIAVAPTNTISIPPVDCRNFLYFCCCSFVVFAVDVTVAL